MFAWPGGTAVVKTGACASAVWDGNRVNAGAMEEMGVVSCGSNEVLVADGRDGIVEAEPGTLV